MIKQLVLLLITLYQAWTGSAFSRTLFGGGGCRFSPTCSRYTYEAVSRYGTIKGLFLGFRRVARCHPFHAGGLDPVP